MSYYVGQFEDGKPFMYSDEDIERMRKNKDQTTVDNILNAFNSGKARKTDNKELAEKAYKPMQNAWNNKVIEDANNNKVQPSIDSNKIKSDVRAKFKLPSSFNSKQEYDKFYDDLTAAQNELRAQISNFPAGSIEQQQAQATLNEVNAIRSEAINIAKNSNISEVVDTATQNDDKSISPEAGASGIDDLVQKIARGEKLTDEELATWKANPEISSRAAELNGEDEIEILKRYGLSDGNKYAPKEGDYTPPKVEIPSVTNLTSDAGKHAPSLTSNNNNNNSNSTENNGTPPQPQGDSGNNGDNNMADKDKDKDNKGSNKLWDSYKSGGLDPYPTLKAVTDIISNNARMNLDRAALLTGGQRDLDAYKPIETETDKIRDKQVDERAQFGGITKAEALEAARNDDWDGVRKIAGMGGFSDQELSMFSGMNLPDDLQKLWSNKMRKDEAETESTETKTKQEKQQLAKSYDDQIAQLRAEKNANNELIRKLSGTDYEAMAEAANTLKGIYADVVTQTTGGGTANTKTDQPFTLQLEIMSQKAGTAFGDSSSETVSNSSSTTVQKAIQENLDGIIKAADEHTRLKGEVNDEVIKLLQERNTEIDEEIDQLKQDKAKALGDKMYFGQDHEPIEKKDDEKKEEEETKE